MHTEATTVGILQGSAVCLHVNASPELGHGQKAAALIDMRRRQNKEVNKVGVISHKGLVFLNNKSKMLFHLAAYTHLYAHSNLTSFVFARTYILSSKKTNQLQARRVVCFDVVKLVSGADGASL